MGAKLCVPVIRPSLVLRGRLLDRLSEGVRGVLTLISAPAGSGKSVLASAWVHSGRAPGPVAWLSLDEEDDRPGVFWTYVLAALARSDVPVRGIGTPDAEDSIDHSLLVRLAVSLSEGSAPVVLILDNVEVLTRQQIADALDFVVRHASGQLRLVLIARTDPNLPLHRYRLDGSITEIRFPDLAFTYEEAQELLRRRDVSLPDEAVQAFAYHTRGWAAGLRLADADFDGRRNGTSTDSDLAAYFRAEVLDSQPPDVRAFLLTTSVVDHLPPDLAIQLSGSPEGATSLRALAKAKMFVEQCAEKDECYQYHPLVRNLLRAELRIQAASRRRRLHRRAASWLAAAGRYGEAASQHAAAEDWREAACLMIRGFQVPSVLAAGLPDVDPDVLARMPSTTPGPEAAVVAAALAWRENDLTSCEKSLARADEVLAGADTADDPLALRLAAAVTCGVLAATCGDADETLAAAGTTQELLSRLAAEGIVPPPQARALTLWSTGCVQLGTGDLALAREILAAAARTANLPGYEGLRARCLAQLALAEALSGRLVSATETAHRAIVVSERCEGVTSAPPVAADVALAWVNAERGDTAQARALVDGLSAALEVSPDPNCLGVLSLLHVRLQRARGDLVGARAAIERGRKSRPPLQVPVWLTSKLTIAEALLLIIPGHADAAAELLRHSGLIESTEGLLAYGWARLAHDVAEAVRIAKHVLAQPGLALDVRVGAILLYAAGELEASRQDAARAIVDQALALAEPEGLRRPFEEIPPRLRAVLRSRAEGSDGRHWLAGSGGGRGGARPTPGTVSVQPLTDREQEVLGYLAELMSTEEIAARMFVSVNTVKTHVRAILRKLSAERRNDAVRRARELGLL
jgi:LuxR family maltose regulon positive regulatory protein